MNIVYVMNIGGGYGGEGFEDFRALSALDFPGTVVGSLPDNVHYVR